MLGVDADAGFGDIAWRFALLGAGYGLVLGPMAAVAVEAAPHSVAGMAGAVNNTFRQIGAALRPAVLGSILASRAAPALSEALARRRLPGPVREQAMREVAGRGLGAALTAPFGPEKAHVHGALVDACTASMHDALAVGGAGLLLAALAAPVLLRRQPSPPRSPASRS